MLLSILSWDLFDVIFIILIVLAGFFSTKIVIPKLIKVMKKKGYVGIDIHKSSKPKVAESGGISILIGFTIASIFLMLFFPLIIAETIVLVLTVILSGLIGYVDDRIKLKSRYKLILTLLTGFIIFIANLVGFIDIQSPIIPILGRLRLTVIYPLLAPIVVAIFTNAINMLEGYNGEASGTSIITIFFLFICGLIWTSAEAILFSLTALSVLIPFYIYNKYPAKIFPGDVGTLSIGAILAGIALFSSLEAAVFCALFTHIFNSFYVLYSVKGFFESSDIQETRPDVILLENSLLKASDQKNAALTLPRLILAKGKLNEPQLVKNIYAISIICGFFAIFTTLMMALTINIINLVVILIITPILLVLMLILIYIYPKIKGIIGLMLLLIVAGYLLLLIIDLVIMPIDFIDLRIFEILIPLNIILSLLMVIPCLFLWYYISIRYFWSTIDKMKMREHDRS